jgi:hypothetical protein
MLHHMGTYLYSNWYLGTAKFFLFPVDGNLKYTQLYSLPHVAMAFTLLLELFGINIFRYLQFHICNLPFTIFHTPVYVRYVMCQRQKSRKLIVYYYFSPNQNEKHFIIWRISFKDVPQYKIPEASVLYNAYILPNYYAVSSSTSQI